MKKKILSRCIFAVAVGAAIGVAYYLITNYTDFNIYDYIGNFEDDDEDMDFDFEDDLD